MLFRFNTFSGLSWINIRPFCNKRPKLGLADFSCLMHSRGLKKREIFTRKKEKEKGPLLAVLRHICHIFICFWAAALCSLRPTKCAGAWGWVTWVFGKLCPEEREGNGRRRPFKLCFSAIILFISIQPFYCNFYILYLQFKFVKSWVYIYENLFKKRCFKVVFIFF